MADEQSEIQAERQEWLAALDYVLQQGDRDRVRGLLEALHAHTYAAGVELPRCANTPYINTITADRQPPYPGSREVERRIKSMVRWNAMEIGRAHV